MNSSNSVDLSQSALKTHIFKILKKPNQPNPISDNINEPQITNQFCFEGSESQFLEAIEKMGEKQMEAIEVCNISIIGEQVKEGNPKCLILTLIFSILFVLPFFLFCCNWWKKAVSQVFSIQQKTYVKMASFITMTKLQSLELKVYDNFLSKKKLNLLLKSIKKSSIKSLYLVNEGGAFDINDEEYTQFLQNVKPFRKLTLEKLYVGWFKKHLQKE